MEVAARTIATYLHDAPHVAEPDVAGPLTVFPLIGPSAELEYQSFAQGRLLFEGEEVVGAQQNRTFDVSVLVPARATLTVPVSCVEAGRWDSSRARELSSPRARQPIRHCDG